MRLGVRRKAAIERRDADVEFGHWLPEGDELTDVSAHAEPEGLKIDAAQLHGTVAKIWLSGGDVGESYTVTVVATTAEGRIKEACFQVNVTEC